MGRYKTDQEGSFKNELLKLSVSFSLVSSCSVVIWASKAALYQVRLLIHLAQYSLHYCTFLFQWIYQVTWNSMIWRAGENCSPVFHVQPKLWSITVMCGKGQCFDFDNCNWEVYTYTEKNMQYWIKFEESNYLISAFWKSFHFQIKNFPGEK